MADANVMQGIMDWYNTNVVPVMDKVRDYMATIDPEGAQQAETLSGMSKGEIPVPTFDEMTNGEQTPVSAGTTSLPPFSQAALPPHIQGAGPSQAGGTSSWPGSYTKMPGSEVPVEEMVSPTGKGKLIGKVLKYGLPVALTAVPALRNFMPNAMGQGASRAAQAATSAGEPVNRNLIDLVNPAAVQSKGDEEKAARQEIEAATSAIKDSPKEDAFDIEEIARKYGNPEGGGYVGPDTGSVFTSKEIAKEDLGGLKKTGYVEKDGKKVYIYSKPEEKKTETAGKPGGDDNVSKITAFENSVIKQMGFDPRTFNPAEEARKAVEAEKDRYFGWTFGGNAHPNYLTPEQAKHWQANLNSLYEQKLKEFSVKQAQGERMLNTLVGRFEKEHIKQPIHVKEGDRVVGYNKTTGKYEDVLSGGPKAGKPLSPDQEKQIDKVLDGIFMDQADNNKMTMNNGKIYESLPKQSRDEYDTLREKTQRIMADSTRSGNPLTAYEAAREARRTSTSVFNPKTKQEAFDYIKKQRPGAKEDQIKKFVDQTYPKLK